MSFISVSLVYKALRMLFFRVLLLCGFVVCAENYNISGKIISEKKEALEGVIVEIHETNQMVETNKNGEYVFLNIQNGTYHLHFSLVGFHSESQTVVVKQNTILDFQMHQSINELHEVVIESNLQKQSEKESSVAIDRVDKAFLQKNVGTTLMATLEKLPGISAINMGVGVSKPVIRGLSFNRVVVSDYGIKQEGQQWGSDHGLEIDQYNIDNVEVLKGPASLMYGSDAMAGVVAIVHPKYNLINTHSTHIQAIARTNNDTYGLTAGAKGNTNGINYKIQVTGLDYADYKVPSKTFVYQGFVLPIVENRLKNTSGSEKHINITVGINKKWGYSHITFSNFNQHTGLFSGAIGRPLAYQLTNDGNWRNIDLPSQNINHFKIINNTNIKLKNNWLEFDFGYQNNYRQENSQPHAHGQGPAITGTKAVSFLLQTLSLNSRMYVNTIKNLDGIIGLQSSFQHNSIGGYEFLIPAFNYFQLGVFLIEKYKINAQWFANAGARIDFATMDIKSTQVAVYDNPTNPINFIGNVERNPNINKLWANVSASVGLSYLPKEWLRLKLNIGKSYRNPTPQELSVNGVHHGTFRHEKGDVGLNPEHGYQFDIGAFVEYKYIYISITPFFNYFDNYIYLRPTARFSTLPAGKQLYQFSQSKATLWGGEITLEYKPMKNIRLSTNVEYVFATNIDANLPMPMIPPFCSQNEFEYEFYKPIKGFLKWNCAIFAPQNRTDRNELETEGYVINNLSLGIKPAYKKIKTSAYFQIQNVFNTLYFNHLSRYRFLGLPEAGRNFMFTLRFEI